jgi:hypothetical protein
MQKELTGMLALLLATAAVNAQDTIRYTGKTLVNVDYHHGQLSPAIGVHSYQTMRARRNDPDTVVSWTYNHAPMLAYWNGTFYLNYLSNPVGEHIPPGQTLLQTSKDGEKWSKPVVIFPPYKIPDGTVKKGPSRRCEKPICGHASANGLFCFQKQQATDARILRNRPRCQR